MISNNGVLLGKRLASKWDNGAMPSNNSASAWVIPGSSGLSQRLGRRMGSVVSNFRLPALATLPPLPSVLRWFGDHFGKVSLLLSSATVVVSVKGLPKLKKLLSPKMLARAQFTKDFWVVFGLAHRQPISKSF
jgi:hypothetical protein